MTVAWPEAQLSEIARPVVRPIAVLPGTQFRTIGVKWWGEGAYERQTIDGSQTAAKILSVVRAGDLIINKIWVRHGSTAIASQSVDGCAASGEFPTFELDPKLVLPQWLHWHTKTRGFWAECDALSRGSSGKNRIKPDLFLTIRVPLPPIDEQRRIVARIEAIAEKVEEARKLRGKADKEAASLAASTANGIFEPLISEDKTTQPLGDLADIVSGVTLGRRLSGRTVTLPYLRVANVQDGHLDLTHMKTVDVLPHEETKWRLEPGDLLLTEGGDWDKLGRGCLWNGEIQNCIHQNHIFRVRVVDQSVLPEFLSAIVGSPAGKAYFQAASKQTTNLASINQRQLKAFPVPVLPMAQQRAIVAELNHVAACVARLRHEQGDTELERVVPAMLDKAFRGEM